jgi:hypothetical protein
MSVATLTESRTYGRLLTLTKDKIVPGIKQCAFDHSPLLAVVFGRMTDSEFGPVRMNGRAKEVQSGGASIEVYHELGKNSTAKTLSGQWDTVDSTPQDNVRFSRANWVHYSATATISETEKLVNTGDSAIASIMNREVTGAVNALADLAGDHIYSNGSDATRLTSLQQIVSASDSVQGLSGTTYTRWNSRGLSARGTAPASVTFDGSASGTSDSFAVAGLTNLRTLYDNASEGMIVPHAGFTTYLLWGAYEASIQAQQRFTVTSLADAGFQNLAFDTAPVFKDSKCTSGEWYFLNFDAFKVYVLAGADFDSLDFHQAEGQEAYSSKFMLKAQSVVSNRLLLNKWINATA